MGPRQQNLVVSTRESSPHPYESAWFWVGRWRPREGAVEKGFHAIMDLAILGQELQAKVTASKQPNIGRPLDRPNDL